MIFLSLAGSMILSLFAVRSAIKHWSEIWMGFESWLLNRNSTSLPKLLTRLMAVAGIHAQAETLRYSAVALWNLQIWNKRPALLMACLFWVGLWPLIAFSEIFMRFNGLTFIGVSGVLFVRELWTRQESSLARFVFSMGLFLVAGELAIRNSTVLLNLAPDFPILFSLMDSSLGNLLVFLLMSFLISLVVRIEYWPLCFVLPLLYVNFVSMLVVMAVFAGERLAMSALLWWRTRDLTQTIATKFKQMSILGLIGTTLGFVLCLILRPSLEIQFGEGLDAFQSKQEVLVILILVLLAMEAALIMIWGHFAAAEPKANSKEQLSAANEEVRYFPESWIEKRLLQGEVKDLILVELGRRKQVLLQRQNEFGDDWSKVPASVQARLKYELSSFVKLIDRLSR